MSREKIGFINKLKALVSAKRGKEAKEKAGRHISVGQTVKTTANKNGNIYGDSPLKNAFHTWKITQVIQKNEWQKQFGVVQEQDFFYPIRPIPANDFVVEVFVTPNSHKSKVGTIQRPFERGIAFEFCKLERWYAPDCRPGIISFIHETNRSGHSDSHVYKKQKPLAVLFAEEQYIELQPELRIVVDPTDLYLYQLHFEHRGFEYLDDTAQHHFGPFVPAVQPDDLEKIHHEWDKAIHGYKHNEIADNHWSYQSGVPNHAVTIGGVATPITSTSWGNSDEWQSKTLQ